MRRLALNRCFRAAPSETLLAAVFVCLSIVLLRIDAHAQFLPSGCPGQWVQGGGGMMCLCPDGTYANMVGNQIVCPPRAQAQPAVGAYCSNGGTCGVGYRCSWMPGKCVPEGKIDCGSYYCEPGFKCSSAKCIALDAADCGDGRYCNAGYYCGFNGKCLPHGNSACGDHSCRPGFICGSNDVCMPEGTVDCGDGRYCTAGSRCEVGRCIGINTVDCGSYSCASGLKCGSGRTCLNRDWVDCGGGKFCAPGQVCVNGGSECLTSAQIADRAATPTQPLNIEQRLKTNWDRAIKALRDIGDWIRDGAAKPFPPVPFDILVFWGSGVLLIALLLINVMQLSRREQVLTHEGPKHPETGRVPSEGHAASPIASTQPDVTSASEPSNEHRDAVGAETSSVHVDSPWADLWKAVVKKSPQDKRDVALEIDGGADKVGGEASSDAIVASDDEIESRKAESHSPAKPDVPTDEPFSGLEADKETPLRSTSIESEGAKVSDPGRRAPAISETTPGAPRVPFALPTNHLSIVAKPAATQMTPHANPRPRIQETRSDLRERSTTMEYKAVGFDPPVTRDGPTESAASWLNSLIAQHASAGWEFIGVQNHSTIVPGNNGCFGFGKTPPYPRTVSIAVFRRSR